jgi:hypothetical protein
MESISSLVRRLLPDRYEPLLLTFRANGEFRDGYEVIGDDEGGELCVQMTTGAVYSIDPTRELTTRFMNSSVPQLAHLIGAHVEYGRAISQTNREEEQLTIVELFRSQIASIDPRALDDPENWWSTIIEQILAGLL